MLHAYLFRSFLLWLCQTVLVGTLLLLGTSVHAQVTNQRYAADNYRPVSPGAYAITKYLDNAVDTYHGLPEISLPVTELKLDGRSFPLSFSYHAGGIRVTEEASWVGLGWDLQLPTIVQLVNDEDDLAMQDDNRQVQARMRPDWPPPGGGQGIAFPKRYSTKGNPANGNPDGIGWTTPYPKDPLTGLPAATTPEKRHYYKMCYDYYVPVNQEFNTQRDLMFNGNVDSEPDVFKVSLFGTTLTFIRNFSRNSFRILNNTTYKLVQPTTTNYYGQGWDLVDGQGFTYHFANRQIQTTQVANGSAFGSPPAADALSTVIWYLTTITSPHGRQATFAYTTLADQHLSVDYKDKYQEVAYTNNSFYSANVEAYTTSPQQGGAIYGTRSLTKERKVYPASLTFDNATVVFYSSSREDVPIARQLDSLVVQRPAYVRGQFAGEQLKRLVLHHDYLPAQSLAATAYPTTFSTQLASGQETRRNDIRLRLTSLYESTSGTYGFTYDPQPLPPRNSFAQDFWGYANGFYTNGSLVPNPTRLGLTDFAATNLATAHIDNNNSAVLAYARAGTLTRITYPTGGSRTFEYELHTFRLPDTQVPDADSLNNKVSKGNGLRIRRIIAYPGLGQPALRTSYVYAGGLTMAPMRYFRTFLYQYCDGQSYLNGGGGYQVLVREYTAKELNASSQYSPGLFGSGTGVGYTHLTEERQTSDTLAAPDANGRTEYFYANRADLNVATDNSGRYYGLQIPSGFSLPFYPDYTAKQNGLLDSVWVRNSQGYLLSRTLSSYRTLTSELDYGVKLFSGGTWFEETGNNNTQPNLQLSSINYLGYYPIFEKTSAKTAEITHQYDAGGNCRTQRVTYIVDDLNRVAAKEVENSAVALGQAANAKPTATYRYFYPDYYPSPSTPGYIALLNANRLEELVAFTESHSVDSRFAPPITGAGTYHYDKYFSYHSNNLVVDSVCERTTYPADHHVRRRRTAYPIYTSWGQPQQVESSATPPVARLWHPTLPLLLAEASNTNYNHVIYSSFEPDTKAGWGTDFPTAGGVAGNWCYDLTTSLALPNLFQPGAYVLSYWAKGSQPLVSASASTATVGAAHATVIRSDGWTQYYQPVTLTGAGVHVSFAAQPGVLLDEVRLCATTARLTTYTYDAWQHLSSQTDPSGRLTTYEYDAAGRLVRTRDEQGRILAQQQYHYAQP